MLVQWCSVLTGRRNKNAAKSPFSVLSSENVQFALDSFRQSPYAIRKGFVLTSQSFAVELICRRLSAAVALRLPFQHGDAGAAFLLS